MSWKTVFSLKVRPYQERVQAWVRACFGNETAVNIAERNYRFLEEGLELVQSLGCTKEEALSLVDYVYARPWGEPKQEVGGVMVTLASLCETADIDMIAEGEKELRRVWGKVPQIRAKNLTKMKGPLPGVNT